MHGGFSTQNKFHWIKVRNMFYSYLNNSDSPWTTFWVTKKECTCLPFLRVPLVCHERATRLLCTSGLLYVSSSLSWYIHFINTDNYNSCPVQHHVFISVVFPRRDLRFNNISIIAEGDLGELRHLTTLWVFLSTRRSLFFLLGDVYRTCT